MKNSKNKESSKNEYNPDWRALNPDYLWQLPYPSEKDSSGTKNNS